MNGSFAPDTLRLLDEAREVRIETRRDGDAPAHRTTIWVVTVDGTVFVRSVRGEEGRWYREKYGRTSPGSTRAMVQPEALNTTLRLEPA